MEQVEGGTVDRGVASAQGDQIAVVAAADNGRYRYLSFQGEVENQPVPTIDPLGGEAKAAETVAVVNIDSRVV